ncbi:MAG: hypothetical protein QOH86_2251 [Sphingomonadales bacterium]|jgi:hypothetical protein|nr:hypothetical protein [Sphingomonadales bacterium]
MGVTHPRLGRFAAAEHAIRLRRLRAVAEAGKSAPTGGEADCAAWQVIAELLATGGTGSEPLLPFVEPPADEPACWLLLVDAASLAGGALHAAAQAKPNDSALAERLAAAEEIGNLLATHLHAFRRAATAPGAWRSCAPREAA